MYKFLFFFIFYNIVALTLAPISAKERLSFVQNLYKEIPDLNMKTPIGERLFNFYKHDRDLILENIINKEDYEVIKERMEDAHRIALSWQDGFSFMDYHLIGYTWAALLSKPKAYGTKWSVKTILEKDRDSFLNKNIYNFAYSEQLREFPVPIISDKIIGIAMPLVLKTGLVDIRTLNQAWGFHVDGKPRFVHFLGVPYKDNLHYDNTYNTTAYDVWSHDWGAHGQDIYEFQSPILAEYAVSNTASLLEQIELLPEDKKPYAHLAFFMLFHESSPEYVLRAFAYETIKKNNKKWIEFFEYLEEIPVSKKESKNEIKNICKIKKNLRNGIILAPVMEEISLLADSLSVAMRMHQKLPDEIEEPKAGNLELEFINAARSLHIEGFPCAKENLLTQYQAYLKAYKEGLTILFNFVDYFDQKPQCEMVFYEYMEQFNDWKNKDI